MLSIELSVHPLKAYASDQESVHASVFRPCCSTSSYVERLCVHDIVLLSALTCAAVLVSGHGCLAHWRLSPISGVAQPISFGGNAQGSEADSESLR